VAILAALLESAGDLVGAMNWQPIDTAPENVVVLTKIDDGRGVRNQQPMKRRGRLWWFADGEMYVYYTPTHWAKIADPPGAAAVDEVLAEAFAAGFEFAMNGHDKHGEYLGAPVEDGFAEWRKSQ
jgi:hypothetical protein